jgi:hypothetical protein
MAMRHYEVPVTKEMMDALRRGKECEWKIDNATIVLSPSFPGEKEKVVAKEKSSVSTLKHKDKSEGATFKSL